jgi:hypothetical protein
MVFLFIQRDFIGTYRVAYVFISSWNFLLLTNKVSSLHHLVTLGWWYEIPIFKTKNLSTCLTGFTTDV